MARPVEEVPPDLANEIEQWISEGKTLRDYCRQPGKPARRTVDDWRSKDAAFAARIARARDIGFDVIAEEALAIADTPLAGQTVTVDDSEKGGTKTVTEDMLGHRKLQVETRLKLLAKWDPKRYGDAVRVAGDKDNPLLPADGELAARVAKLLASAKQRAQ